MILSLSSELTQNPELANQRVAPSPTGAQWPITSHRVVRSVVHQLKNKNDFEISNKIHFNKLIQWFVPNFIHENYLKEKKNDKKLEKKFLERDKNG